MCETGTRVDMASRYDIAHDQYIDPKLGILRNKIGARTQSELDMAEAEISYVAIATLTHGLSVKSLVFDGNLLKAVDAEIFRDIYSWAGHVRTRDISKESGYFAHASFIASELSRIPNELRKDAELKRGTRAYVVKRLAYYYGELNAVYPFREGNGRPIRTFLRLLALSLGYDIDWDRMSPADNISACKAAMKTNYSPLVAMFDVLVVTIGQTKFNPEML